MTKKHVHIAIICTATALTTAWLLYAKTLELSPHAFFEELYYVPLLLGAVRFGLKGAMFTYLFTSAAYITIAWGGWTTIFSGGGDKVLHLIFSGLFALVAGKIVERDRKKSGQIEQERYFAGIGQASTVIVHDLKNPLVTIQGFARRIQEGKGDVSRAAQAISESANTMQRIVNEVLEFARPMQMDACDQDIRPIIRRACEACRTKAREKGIALIENLTEKPLIRECDSFQLERALVNLMDNSIDASSPGGQVAVTALGGKGKLTILIKDHGIGMDRETLNNLFLLTYTTKNEGTGFGVPISKKIIDAHGGTIRVTSQKGTGTEVTVDLPMRKMG